MKKSPFYCTLALAALFAGSGVFSPLEARIWTDAKSGKKIEAELVKSGGGKVTLKLANGRVAEMDASRLVQADQEFIAAQESGGSAGGSDWPQWRGPDQSGISPDEKTLDKWPEGGPEQLWVYKEAGQGYSSPAIVDGRFYTAGSRDGILTVIALDAGTGKEVWASEVAEDDEKGYNAGWGGGPRGTPTVSDGFVYVLGPKGTLVCLQAEDGKKVWDKNLSSDFKGEAGGWGYAESPLVDGDLVVVAPGGTEAAIVALDKKTGKTEWKTEFDAGKAEYATIVPADINGARQYIKLFQTKVVGVDASDGKVLWESEWPRGRTAVIPTPIFDDGEVYVSSGYSAGSKLFKIGPENAVSDVWDNKEMKNHHGGVIKIGDYVYGFSDGDGLVCQDWNTGETVWKEKTRQLMKGTVAAVAGKLICLNESNGVVTLVDASPEGFKSSGSFELAPQSENRNPKGRIWAHPVVLNGKLYLRDQELIHCYDVSAQ